MSIGRAPEAQHLPLLRGQGRYIDDLPRPDALHVAFARSPHAHARIGKVDLEAAREMPGVAAVLGAADIASAIAPIEARMAPQDHYQYRATRWQPMAGERVRYVGEIVALVVAADRYLAEDAAEQVMVDYEPLPAAADAGTARGEAAPRVHDEHPDNILFRIHRENGEDVFDQAPVRLSMRARHPRVAGLSMENCGAVADYHPGNAILRLWSSTQVPHLIRDGLSRCLDLPANRIRVMAPDVGGAFGIKMQLFPEEVLLGHLAMRLARPVKWIQDRSEHLLASFHSRDVTVDAEIAADNDGTLLGIRATSYCDVGAYSSYPLTCSLEPQTIGTAIAGPYNWRYYDYRGHAVATNKYPQGAYRGVGFPVGPLVLEPLIDRLARRLDMDPAALRRKNLVPPDAFPFQSLSGAVYDSGDYPALLDLAMERAGYDEWRARQREPRADGRRLGVGIASFIEPTGMNRKVYRGRGMLDVPAFESAQMKISADGHVDAAVSTPTQGQSHFTTFRMLLAQRLGIDGERIHVTLGDTDVTPYGAGTFGSRSVVASGGALLVAARRMVDKLERLAALHWGVARDAVEYVDGAVHRRDDPATRLGFDELAALAYSPMPELPADLEPGLTVQLAYDPPSAAISTAVHLALVSLDERTGHIAIERYVVAEDCGPIINETAVDGQIRGGVAQGLGIALYEEVRYDEDGQHLSTTLQDYLVPGSVEMPDIDIVHMETPSPFTEGGHKGMGESGTIGAPAAIASAVADALGVAPETLELPLTPERVRALVEAGEHD